MATVYDRIDAGPARRALQAELNRRELAERALAGAVLGKLAGALEAAYHAPPKRGEKARWRTLLELAHFENLDEPGSEPVPMLARPFEWYALAILAPVLAPWVNDDDGEKRAPAVATVAKAIGRTLGASERDLRPVGNALLAIAEQAGVLELRSAKIPNSRRRDALRVYPSPSTRAELREIHAKLATLPDLAEHPTETEPVPDVRIRPNRTGLLEPPQPIGEAVADALEIVQGTQWRVNNWAFSAFLEFYSKAYPDARNAPADAIAALEQAGALASLPRFYYRHSFDWRGRMYQRGGALQWTGGADLARGLLEFANGEPLNADGEYWLGHKYLASLCGVKSVTAAARWVSDRTLIERCATDPVGCLLEWRNEHGEPFNGPAGESPFTFLAACRAFVEGTKGEPVHVPIVLDATCSGLQHYAWLMRDVELGRRVRNVEHCGDSLPDDFYSAVGERVGKPRSFVKRPAMTTFYGATAETIGRQLGERKPYALASRIIREAWAVAGTPARALYDWLRDVERAFTQTGEVIERHPASRKGRQGRPKAWAGSRPIYWTAPSGFRVVHDERQQRAWTLEIPQPGRTPSGKGRKRTYTELRSLETIDANAQRRGIAPNFIHSMDAALLVETVRQGRRAGIRDWALAHDAFGSHPNHGTAIESAAQLAAIAIYSADVLANVASEFEAQGVELPPMPEHPAELPFAFVGGKPVSV